MKIAVIYIAEPYQGYHVASVSNELASIPGIEITEYFNFEETKPHLARIRLALGVPSLPNRSFYKSMRARVFGGLHRWDRERVMVLRDNVAELNRYDAVIASEYTAGLLREMGLAGPKLILLMHGAGDRYVNDEYLVRNFDLTLVSGPKIKAYFVEQDFLDDRRCLVVGYPKFDVFDALRKTVVPPFSDGRPFVLYNPHYQRQMTSYPLCARAIIDGFGKQERYNLVIAPHIKVFHKGFGHTARGLKKQESAHMKVDIGSPALLDMTYTSQAAIYVGDVSSQVYEFLIRPRPCVFLNPRKLDWQGSPHSLHWTLGEVVESPQDIMAAIDRAPERHHLYRPLQEQLFRETFRTPLLGASRRAAVAIADYLASESSRS